MSIRGLKKWALLLTFWVALQTRYLKADDQTIGNLTVTGTANLNGSLTVAGTTDLQGDTLTIGTLSNDPNYGVLTLYTDNGTISSLEFDATRAAHVWKWQQNGGATLQMTLDNNNKLTLYDQSSPTPNANIVLNPLGTSTFANSLTIGGTLTVSGADNEMPYQTLVNANSVLTEGLADQRYLSSSNEDIVTYDGLIQTLNYAGYLTVNEANSDYVPLPNGSNYYAQSLGSSNASGHYSTAMGMESTASGNYSTAMGTQTTAYGTYSTAMGWWSTASGYASMSMGDNSSASGWSSTAMGEGSNATGMAATAMGRWSTASGTYSTAMGYQTTASAFEELVLGQFNVGTINPASDVIWIATDPLLELGNGTDSSHLSDALLVDKSGNATFQGNVNAASVNTTGVITASGGVMTTPASVAQTDIPMYTGN